MMIEEFREIYRKRYQHLGAEARRRKVVGWVCTYVPQEIIYAAGMLPTRIVGTPGTTPHADSLLYSNTCSFVRYYLEEGLKGCYDFLSGFVTADGCMQTRRAMDTWVHQVKTPFNYFLNLPHSLSELSLDFFKAEVALFRDRLAEFFGVEVSDRELRQAIEVYNRSRALLKKLWLLRAHEAPPLTGAEALEVFMAGTVLDRARYNELLEKLLEELTPGQGSGNKRIRLLVLGSELDDSGFIELIEEAGALVVTDDLCTGTRTFWEPVDTQKPPLEALAEHYLSRVACPRVLPEERRLAFLEELIALFQVKGVIYQRLKWCHLHGGMLPLFRRHFEEKGFPFLAVERDYALTSAGQLRTRVEAFLEGIAGVV